MPGSSCGKEIVMGLLTFTSSMINISSSFSDSILYDLKLYNNKII